LREVCGDLNAWSQNLSSQSIQASYAIIAANWAIHGSSQMIMKNIWAQASILTVLVFFGINLITNLTMTEWYLKRYNHAEKNPEEWEREFRDWELNRTAWPWTKRIENMGSFIRRVRVIYPLFASGLFILSLMI